MANDLLRLTWADRTAAALTVANRAINHRHQAYQPPRKLPDPPELESHHGSTREAVEALARAYLPLQLRDLFHSLKDELEIAFHHLSEWDEAHEMGAPRREGSCLRIHLKVNCDPDEYVAAGQLVCFVVTDYAGRPKKPHVAGLIVNASREKREWYVDVLAPRAEAWFRKARAMGRSLQVYRFSKAVGWLVEIDAMQRIGKTLADDRLAPVRRLLLRDPTFEQRFPPEPALNRKVQDFMRWYQLNEAQATVLYHALLESETFVQGGPGTGKTRVAEALVREHIAITKSCRSPTRPTPLDDSVNHDDDDDDDDDDTDDRELLTLSGHPQILIVVPTGPGCEHFRRELLARRTAGSSPALGPADVLRVGWLDAMSAEIPSTGPLLWKGRGEVVGLSHDALKAYTQAKARWEKAREEYSRFLSQCDEGGDDLPREVERLRTAEMTARRHLHASRSYIKAAKRHLQRASVIICTPAAASISLLELLNVKLLIIDNAGMVSLPSFAVPLVHVKSDTKIVMLGDHLQLQPANHGRDDISHRHSLLWHLLKAGFYVHQLYRQYRFNDTIAEALNEWRYNSTLITDDSNAGIRVRLSQKASSPLPRHHPLHHECAFIEVDWSFEEKRDMSSFNKIEAALAVELVRDICKFAPGVRSIAIITPYSAQRQDILKAFKNDYELDRLLSPSCSVMLDISTVDAFQGRQADIVIYSTVRSEHPGFTLDPHRVTSALSRVRKALWVVGTSDVQAPNITGESTQAGYSLMDDFVLRGKVPSKFNYKCANLQWDCRSKAFLPGESLEPEDIVPSTEKADTATSEAQSEYQPATPPANQYPLAEAPSSPFAPPTPPQSDVQQEPPQVASTSGGGSDYRGVNPSVEQGLDTTYAASTSPPAPSGIDDDTLPTSSTEVVISEESADFDESFFSIGMFDIPDDQQTEPQSPREAIAFAQMLSNARQSTPSPPPALPPRRSDTPSHDQEIVRLRQENQSLSKDNESLLQVNESLRKELERLQLREEVQRLRSELAQVKGRDKSEVCS